MILTKGEQFYMPADKLGIEQATPLQQYKVQIHKLPVKGSDTVLVVVKHFKTKKCNKVTLSIKKGTIINHGTKVTD